MISSTHVQPVPLPLNLTYVWMNSSADAHERFAPKHSIIVRIVDDALNDPDRITPGDVVEFNTMMDEFERLKDEAKALKRLSRRQRPG